MSERNEWQIRRDPARPTWPGVVIAGPNDAFVAIEAGSPKNFADSNALAERIVAALSGGPQEGAS